jgi:hypothetical protein
MALAAAFDDIDAVAERSAEKLPPDGSIDLGLALHMIYFVNDLPASVTRMVRFLKPGGVQFVVVTDETVGYTGLALKKFYRTRRRRRRQRAPSLGHRRRAAACSDCPRRAAARLPKCSPPRERRWKSTCGASRAELYGHNLADLIRALLDRTSRQRRRPRKVRQPPPRY